MTPEADPMFVEALRLIASNDGQSYAERDPGLAVLRAFREYQRCTREAEREDFALCAQVLIDELKLRWRQS